VGTVSFSPTSLNPFCSKRRMISPTRPRFTPEDKEKKKKEEKKKE